jgi:hypothetical protein
MSICPGGLTQARPGVANFVNLGSSGAGLLSAIPRFAALAPIAYALTGVSLTTSVLCGSEPPGFPTFTQNEVNVLLNNNFIDQDYATALGKLKDTLTTIAWYTLCECQTGGVQTLPTPPVQPTPPAVTPTNIPNTTTTCAVKTSAPQTWASFGNGRVNANPGVVTQVPGAKGLHFTITQSLTGGGSPSPSTGHVDAFNASGQSIRVEDFTIPAAGAYDLVYAIDPLWPNVKYSLTPDNGGSPTGQLVDTTAELTCSGDPSIGPSACCPPDPLIVAKLDKLDALVTLLQRQLAPFSYVMGATHAGLTGAGVLDVQGLLGAKIELTSDPTTLGIEGTSPTELFDRGWITWGTADGYPQSERLQHNPQLSLPARASAFTELAYDLHPGVVVTITEIVREAN